MTTRLDYRLHNGRLKITHEDQFVPLFLATSAYTTDILGASTRYKDQDISLVARRAIDNLDVSLQDLSIGPQSFVGNVAGIMKGELLKRYNRPTLKEYSFSMPDYLKLINAAGTDLISGFAGTTTYYTNHGLSLYIASLGFLVKHVDVGSVPYHTLASRQYKPMIIGVSSLCNYVPLLLIVVKVKYLSYIAACVGMGVTDWKLPVNALKIIKSTVAGNDDIAKYLQKTESFNKFIEVQKPTIEYLDSRTITDRYLYKQPKDKGVEQYLSDAVYALEHEEVLQEVI